MLLRGIIGVMIGVGYGVLLGALTFLYTHIGRDPAYPGPMIPNENEAARIFTIVAMILFGTCGALTGLIVGISSVGRGRAGTIGFGIGFLVLALLSVNSYSALASGSALEWLHLLIMFIILPGGLAIASVLVSIAVSRLESSR
jgi:hypothetical protein